MKPDKEAMWQVSWTELWTLAFKDEQKQSDLTITKERALALN